MSKDDYYQKCQAEMSQNGCRHAVEGQCKAINVGCMKPWMDYEPRSLKEILEYHNEI